MKPYTKYLKSTACAVGIVLSMMGSTQAQQVPIPTTAAEVPGPALGIAMTKEYVQMVGRMAYIWGWPLVNMANRYTAMSTLPEPGLVGGVLPFAHNSIAMLTDYVKPDQRFVVCINQDVVYGIGMMNLDETPIVMQVPDFGDRFWVYAVWDARTDEFTQIGKQYGTQPGFYMIVGPNWKGETPAGITAVTRSSTPIVLGAARAFMDDTEADRKAIQPLLSQILFYPLSDFDGKMQTKDWSKIPHYPAPPSDGKGETKWVRPETFFDELPAVMKLVPPLPGEEALYGWINSVWEAAATDPATKQALVESFVAAEQELIAPLIQWKYNGRAAGNGWTSGVNNAAWGTDYLNRTATAKSNMYDTVPAETKYIYTDGDSAGIDLRAALFSMAYSTSPVMAGNYVNVGAKYPSAFTDADGDPLDGARSYRLRVPANPPAKLFWSVTLYDFDTMSGLQNGQPFPSINQMDKPAANADGSVELSFGPQSPGEGKNYIATVPGKRFWIGLRLYGPAEAFYDQSWKPDDVEKAT